MFFVYCYVGRSLAIADHSVQGRRGGYLVTDGVKDSQRLANKTNMVHSFSWYVYFFSLHVSGDYVPIIGRNNCIYAMLGTCYSVWMTVWYAPCILDRLWAHSRPKCIEKRNKHTKKYCAASWLYLQDYTFRTAVHLFPVETSNLKIL